LDRWAKRISKKLYGAGFVSPNGHHAPYTSRSCEDVARGLPEQTPASDGQFI
jgi:hypothetical protein